MHSRSCAAAYILRFEPCRRSNPFHRSHHLVRLLCCIVRNNGWRCNPASGGGDASGGPRRISAGFPAVRTFVSSREHSCQLEMDLALRLGTVLHRDRARRALAGRWLARHLVQGLADRAYRNNFLFCGMGEHAPHATEGVIVTIESHWLFNNRLRSLIKKEFNQIRRDRRLAMSLILPSTLQLLLFGFALSADVTNLRLGVVDDSKTPESRELIATMSESKSFRLAGYYFSTSELGDAISRGQLDAGIVIPYDYARDLQRKRPTTVQFILNAMNANTAAIGQAYAEGVVQNYNRVLGVTNAQPVNHNGRVLLQPAFLYNPGLVDSWFIATGVFGLLLILNSSLVASGAMVKEREAGTIEQLLMSPASTSEIIVAKITPLFVLLCLMMFVA